MITLVSGGGPIEALERAVFFGIVRVTTAEVACLLAGECKSGHRCSFSWFFLYSHPTSRKPMGGKIYNYFIQHAFKYRLRMLDMLKS
jgi:hypothetical protein